MQRAGELYDPLLAPGDEPAIPLNRQVLDTMRSEMESCYYDPSQHDSYLEQLGIDSPPR